MFGIVSVGQIYIVNSVSWCSLTKAAAMLKDFFSLILGLSVNAYAEDAPALAMRPHRP